MMSIYLLNFCKVDTNLWEEFLPFPKFLTKTWYKRTIDDSALPLRISDQSSSWWWSYQLLPIALGNVSVLKVAHLRATYAGQIIYYSTALHFSSIVVKTKIDRWSIALFCDIDLPFSLWTRSFKMSIISPYVLYVFGILHFASCHGYLRYYW